MTNIGNYRTAEGEILDVTKPDVQGFLKNNYPAIMTNRPVGMSHGYNFMPSYTIALNMQERFDMGLVEVGQQFSRARDPRGQEHFMKFRLPSSLAKLKQVGDSAPELVIMNSHNGRTTIRAYAGIFRPVCLNGMVVSEKSFGQIKLRHFGEKNTFDEFGKVLDVMARRMKILDNRMGKMKQVMLTAHEENQLAYAVMKMRGTPTWVEAADVLQVRRSEDSFNSEGKRSLWVAFNCIQENLTSQQVTHIFEGARNRSLRPLTGARAHILTNEKIWQGLENFIEAHLPSLVADTFDIIEAKATEVLREAVPELAPEDQEPVDRTIEPIKLRTVEQLLALKTFAEIDAISSDEYEILDKETKTKLQKRKSYLRSKEKVDA